jgi:hypothetical protein
MARTAGCSTCSSVLSTRPVALSTQSRPCAGKSRPASPWIIAGDPTSLYSTTATAGPNVLSSFASEKRKRA